jgi:hypothetical protein
LLVLSSLLLLLCIYTLEQVLSVFEDLGMSVDCVSTSEVSVSMSLIEGPAKLIRDG